MKLRNYALILLGVSSAAWAGDPIIGPQVRIDTNGGAAAANETSAASISPLGNEIVGTWNDWRAGTQNNEVIRMGVGVSNDGGANWTDFLVRPPTNNQSGVEGDPMTAYDSRTGTLWVGAISFAGNGGLYVARKNPGQNTFQPSVMARVDGGADKCWMAAGPIPGNQNVTNLYITYNGGCLRSADMGQTWSAPVGLGSGIAFLPRVAPNGNVYVTWWDFGTGVMFAKSTNGGQSFSTVRAATRMDTWGTQDGSRGPGNFRKPAMNTMAVDPNTGAIYIVYWDTTNIVNGNRNLDLYMTTSTDAGAHWSTPRIVNNDNTTPGAQFFAWLEIDAKSRMHMTWWDSRSTAQNNNGTNGFYDNYYAYSDDGWQSWREFRLTPNTWNSHNDGLNRGQDFVGDYNALALGGGRVYPVYLSTQNGNPDTFTNVIVDPEVVPSSYSVGPGIYVSGGLIDLFRSDDGRLVFRNGITINSAEFPIKVVLTGVGSIESPSAIRFLIESRSSTPGLRRWVDLYNWSTGLYEQIDQHDEGTSDAVTTVDITSNASRFVQPGTRAVKAQIRYRPFGAIISSSWQIGLDQVEWIETP